MNEFKSKFFNRICTSIKRPTNTIASSLFVNPNIIGGFIVRFDGKEYNASIKQNLNNLKTELTN